MPLYLSIIMDSDLKKSMYDTGRICAACIILLQCFVFKTAAGDSDQEIFNRLYREIMSSAPNGQSVKTDSMVSAGEANPPEATSARSSERNDNSAEERLKNEIEKIVHDAQLRHADAVKFMEDAK
jgi:hypothetical protein